MGIETAVIGATVGGSLFGAREQRKGAEAAAAATTATGLAGIEAQERAESRLRSDLAPFAGFGESALDPLRLMVDPSLRGDLTSTRDRLQASLERGDKTGDYGVQGGRRSLERAINSIDSRLSGLPDIPQQVDLAALPSAPTAFDPSAVQDNPIYDFLLEEGFRGIQEAGAGGGRNVDRDLVRFAQGTAATLVPQLQAQQFGQQQAVRGSALAEQAGLRGEALQEQQQRINNLLSAVGIGQSSAAQQGVGGLQTASNIGNLLSNVGAGQAQAALAKSQGQQQLVGNLIGTLGLAAGSGMFGGGGRTVDPNALNLAPFNPQNQFGGSVPFQL